MQPSNKDAVSCKSHQQNVVSKLYCFYSHDGIILSLAHTQTLIITLLTSPPIVFLCILVGIRFQDNCQKASSAGDVL